MIPLTPDTALLKGSLSGLLFEQISSGVMIASLGEGKILRANPAAQEILGVPIRKVVIPVAAGRNLAVLLEAAVRNTILQLRGIDSMSEFINRQQQAVLDGNI